MSGAERPILRVGQGWDLHRLDPGGPLRLAGVDLPHDRAARGHSDGDVVLHAITDALLGAIGAGDIGQHFSDSDPRWKDADSAVFLSEALRLVAGRGYALGTVDVTVILERPKLAPHRDAILSRLAELMKVPRDRLSLKAKTNEQLGEIGRGEAIAAMSVVGLTAA